jgi:hypothetical protein
MKRYLVFITLFGLASCSEHKPAPQDDKKLSTSLVNNPLTAEGVDPVAADMKPILAFADTVHDFGAMHEDEIVSFDFTFTNEGKTPLVITSASGSCGCTVPEYPRDPIAPGQSGIMKVTFNSTGKYGHQEKSVMIHSNTMRNTHMLYIKADVERRKQNS